MKPLYARAGAAVALTFAIAACVPRTAPPAPVPVEPRAPVSLPPAAGPTPTYSNWMDAPATPGNWTYSPVQGGSAALFGEPQRTPLLTMRCDRSQRQVHLEQPTRAPGPASVAIRTETMERTIASTGLASPQQIVRTSVAASDRLLDAMALSKGRFAIEAPGVPTLYLPSWPEVTRVIEDCRG